MAAPKNPKPGKGKKSVSWREDPEILRRLSEVEDLVLSGYRNSEIVAYFNGQKGKNGQLAPNQYEVSEATIRRDRERIEILWREQAASDIVTMRWRSVSNLRRIQRLADNDYRRAKDNDLLEQRPAYLRVQLDAEKEIAKLQGTPTPVTQPIDLRTDPNSGLGMPTADMLAKAAALEQIAQKLLGEKQAAEDTQDQADPAGPEAESLGA